MITLLEYILVIYWKCYVVAGEILGRQNVWNYSVGLSYIYFLLFKPGSPIWKCVPAPSTLLPFSSPFLVFRNFPNFTFPYFSIILKTLVHSPQQFWGLIILVHRVSCLDVFCKNLLWKKHCKFYWMIHTSLFFFSSVTGLQLATF